MSTCHGFWSIGAMVGALIGAGFAQFAIPTALHLAIIAVIALPISVAIALSLPKSGEGRSAAPSGTPFAMPTVGMLGLCVFAVGAIMVETAARNWSAVFLRDEVHASPGMAGLGFSVFGLFMAGGRLIGDRMADRFGAVAFARACCLCTLVGLLILATAANAAVGFAGLAAAGFGVSVLFPLSVSAAAARGDRPAALNVAALALVAYSGSLAAAPLIGFVAEAAGLRIGIGAVIPAILLSTLLAGELTRRASLGGSGGKAGA
jgi:MFS family permease